MADSLTHAPPQEANEAQPLIDVGLALYARGRRREALAMYRRALDIEPDNALAHYVAGLALQATGRVDEARAALETATTVGQESEKARWANGMARQLLEQLGP